MVLYPPTPQMEILGKIDFGNCDKTYPLLIHRFHDSFASLQSEAFFCLTPCLQMSVLSLVSLLQSLVLLANAEKCSSVSHLCKKMALLRTQASSHNVLAMSAKYMFFLTFPFILPRKCASGDRHCTYVEQL